MQKCNCKGDVKEQYLKPSYNTFSLRKKIAKDVTISIECGKDRKRVYFRKNQNIKGVLKIPASELARQDCFLNNAEDSPDENAKERLDYYFLILNNEVMSYSMVSSMQLNVKGNSIQ